jgi:histidine triad (HIT) family protein
MSDCLFCKIANGEIPVSLIGESEHAVAFKDIHPKQPMHFLVVPKQHFADVAELAESSPAVLTDLVQLGVSLSKKHSDGSFRLQFNTGAGAGQTVFHAHGHFMSRGVVGLD